MSFTHLIYINEQLLIRMSHLFTPPAVLFRLLFCFLLCTSTSPFLFSPLRRWSSPCWSPSSSLLCFVLRLLLRVGGCFLFHCSFFLLVDLLPCKFSCLPLAPLLSLNIVCIWFAIVGWCYFVEYC